MKKIFVFIILVLIISGCVKEQEKVEISGEEVNLPEPKLDSGFSIEKALFERSSVRTFKDEALSLEDISQLLWAAQGIDGVTGATRTAPSAGATHPLEIYLLVEKVNGLEKGVYHYNPKKNIIILTSNKEFKYGAPAVIVLAAEYGRTTKRYSGRGIRYVHIEIGHVAQNIHLQAISLGLGSYPIGAFDDDKVKEGLSIKEDPLYIIPIGKV